MGLEGFDPVEVVKVVRHARLHSDPPRYFRVDVVRSRAAIDDTASNVVREEVESICPDRRLGGVLSRVRGLVLEPSPPPTEDLFEVRGLSGAIMASERFKDFCTKHEFRNAIVIPAADYSLGFISGPRHHAAAYDPYGNLTQLVYPRHDDEAPALEHRPGVGLRRSHRPQLRRGCFEESRQGGQRPVEGPLPAG